MFVVIFRARIRSLDDEYSTTAARMRTLALEQFGCLEFTALNDGPDEVALSYWPDEASIRAWKSHLEHVLAQQAGRDRWYESYHVEVAEVHRHYRWPADPGSPLRFAAQPVPPTAPPRSSRSPLETCRPAVPAPRPR